MSRSSYRRFVSVALALLILLTVASLPFVQHRALSAVQTDPVTAAWEKARAAGSYRFASTITQKTIPIATIANVGRASRSDDLYLEGQTDLRANVMDLSLWSEGGSILDSQSSISVRMENGRTLVRRGAGEWEEVDSFTEAFAPHGDFLTYLTALRNIQAHPPEQRNGLPFTRYSFEIDSPAFALYMRDQMEAAMRAKGELPPGLSLETPRHFQEMVGSGELWVGENGLPLRQLLTLQFPEQHDEYVHAQITVDFSNFGTPQQVSVLALLAAGDMAGLWAHISPHLPNPAAVWTLFSMLLLVGLMVRFRRVRHVYATLAGLVILSQTAGPLLSAFVNLRFFDAQAARAAAAEERQIEREAQIEMRDALFKNEFDPHANPMARVAASAVESQKQAAPAAPASLLTDTPTDTDGDGLRDFIEERINTSVVISDTDSDGLGDNVEVNGFSFGGQTWYTNPEAADSNSDGQGDALEWGFNADGSRRSTPLDSDSDGLPDLFDPDNDNDGVPDNKDIAIFSKGTTSYTEAAPLLLTLNDLTANKPTFVEFQLRPANIQHLWYAFNLLDWPQDSLGQVRDVDGATYADYAASAGRTAGPTEANGDMKIIPMLEIRMPDAGVNLPLQSELTPFNISVNDVTANGQTKVAYIPLNIVNDDRTGQRVAFSGQMRYKPSGNWPNPHQVRLAWLVQALVDQGCDPTKPDEVAQGCQPDGYIHNQPQTIQTYYTDWSLTGMTVREDHGAAMGIFYEDPAMDTNKKDDAAITAISFVMDHHFVLGRNDRLTLNEAAKRFDHTRNSNYTDDQRFGVPRITRAMTQTYSTIDQAIAFTAMTETIKILNDQFAFHVAADRDIKPLIFFAQENNTRQMGLDNVIAADGYVTQSGANLIFDMAPSGQPVATVDLIAGVKWAAYCAPAAGPISWQPCLVEDFWEVLENRYASLAPLAGDGGDPTLVSGRLQLTQFYFTGLQAGYYNTVQQGNQLLTAQYSLDGESQTATNVRASLQGLSTVPLLAGLAYARVIEPLPNNRSSIIVKLSKWASDIRGQLKTAQAGEVKVVGKTKIQNIRFAQYGVTRFFGGLAGAAGTILMVIFQITALSPTVDMTTRKVLGGLAATLSLGINVVMPILQTTFGIQGGAATLSKALSGAVKIANSIKIGAGIGLVISIGITWGFFIYAAATSGLAVGSPQLNKLAVEAIASTVVAVVLFLLAANPIGLIVVGIVAFIDLVLTLICELGVDELRIQGSFYGGACFTLSTSAVKVLSYFLYNYDLMVNMERSDLVVTSPPDVTLANPDKGYTAGNLINVNLSVTTTMAHKDPDPENGLYIYPYLWLFSQDNIRSGTFSYSLTRPDKQDISVSRGQMPSLWQNVVEDHKLILTPMYRGNLISGPLAMTPPYSPTAGLNQRISFYFNMGYAVPAYECFGLPYPWPPFVPPIPICYTRDSTGNSSNQINSLVYDIFPPTLDGFLTLVAKSDNGRGLGWDPAFPSIKDSDGDGLLSSIHNGMDPNDTLVDNDSDGLTDLFELNQQSRSLAFSPGLRDTDADGLSDWQEAVLGSDPAVADTDNDGLLDGEEVRHQVVDGNGVLTSSWEGGWQVRINTTTPFNVWVSSDPLMADTDGDGISDQAERQLALSTCSAGEIAAGNCEGSPAKPKDNQNRPYHPRAVNTPPISLYVETSDFDGYVRPTQTFRYTSTVVANTAVAPGVLNVTAPTVVGGSLNPQALAFNPLTFSGAQTVTQGNNLTVSGGAGTQEIELSSSVTTRLPNTGAADWTWETFTNEQLPSVSLPESFRTTALAAARPDRQDSYRFAATEIRHPPSPPSDGQNHNYGDLLSYAIPSGDLRQLDVDVDALNTAYTPAEIDGAFLRGKTSPDVACNDAGVCLVVWEHFDYCNTMTINSLTVLSQGNDHGTSGIEPLIYLVRDPNDADPTNGGFELHWDAQNNGGNDMPTGAVRGPNGGGFPINITFCGRTNLYVSELDGGAAYDPDPTQTNWGGMAFMGSNTLSPTDDRGKTRDLDFIGGDSYWVRLNVSVGSPSSGRHHSIAGALLAADGTISGSQFTISPTNSDENSHYSPAAASNGANFLVVWENLEKSGAQRFSEINTRLLNSSGGVLNTQVDIDPLRLVTNTVPFVDQSYADLDVVWATDKYILTRQMRPRNGVTELRDAGNNVISANLITARNISSGGSMVVNSTTTVVSDANNVSYNAIFPAPNHSLAWDPARGNALIVYQSTTSGELRGKLFGNQNIGPVKLNFSGNSVYDYGVLPKAAYHPMSQGWLVSSYDPTDIEYRALEYDLSGSLVSGAPPNAPFDITTNSLACPAAQSAASIDLRFEELPGATTFADSSGRGANATCSGGNCPAAGFSGAPNAPLSDYAVKFDGADDFVTINRAMTGSFSVAYWIKANNNAVNNAIVVDQGANVANGWTLYLSNGAPAFLIGASQNIVSAGRIDDGQWHFVVGVRNQATGAFAIYVDGNATPVASGVATTAALNAMSDIRMGGDRSNARDLNAQLDHVQVFPVALAGDTIQAIYNRTLQGFCVNGGTDDPNWDRLRWTRVKLSQQDTRGGRVAAGAALNLIIDNDLPAASVTSVQNSDLLGPDQVIGGTASDATSGVASVEVSINNGAWTAANGASAWSFSLAGFSGALSIRARAIDFAGNLGNPSSPVNVTVDASAPTVTINQPANTIKPTRNANGQWQVTLTGTATDNMVNNIKPGSVLILLKQHSGVGAAQTEQVATLSGVNWSIDYALDISLFDPTGPYTVTARAEDTLGNLATPATAIVRLDIAGPVAALSQGDATRMLISDTVTLSGRVTDVNSIAGVDTLEIAFTPIDQLASLPPDATSDQAEALLNRTWLPVNLAQRGVGVATSAWSVQVPANLEGEYQIDLRGRDMLGNIAISANQWRGIIDVLAPRMLMSATPTGLSYFDPVMGAQRYAIAYVCAAVDRNLNGDSFDCPGEGIQPPLRSFENNPGLQALFPDLTIRNGLAISYTLWETTTTPAATVNACDTLGHCASASTPGTGQAANNPAVVPPPGAPFAMVVAPAEGQYVAVDGGVLNVTVAAEAGQSLKEIALTLDNSLAASVLIAQNDVVTRTLRTVTVTVNSEGPHTIAARASDWANAVQATVYPINFIADMQHPTATIISNELTLSDTFQALSGILRFRGAASDTIGLATVQVRIGDDPFTDAAFANGLWHTALPVADPEGKDLLVTVRAMDLAGRITTITRTIPTRLSAADAPDTQLTVTPPNPSSTPTITFGFVGAPGGRSVAMFECKLDEAEFGPCASPHVLGDLSKGGHNFQVRAIDSLGFPDLSPATFTWHVNAIQPETFIDAAPENPTTSRSARFQFHAGGPTDGFECSLDGAVYTACVSPLDYSDLADGLHTFLVRAKSDPTSSGSPTRHVWTVVNAAPIAESQAFSVTYASPLAIELTALDEDSPLNFRIIDPPVRGVLQGAPPNVTYAPDLESGGPDQFTFKANDGQADSNLGVITLDVEEPPPATIVLRKVVVGQAAPAPWHFTWQYNGPSGVYTLPGAGGVRVFGDLGRGRFGVTETPQSGYTPLSSCVNGSGVVASGGASVDFVLTPGQTITCTFTNTRTEALVTIVKEATPKSNQNFNFNASPRIPLLNTGGEGGVLSSFMLDDAVPSDNDAYPKSRSFLLPNGVYNFSEVLPTSWRLAAIDCVNTGGGSAALSGTGVQLTLTGFDVTCTFRNELLASIRTLVYNDANGNGVRNSGEGVLASWSISATLQPAGPSLPLLTTNSLGRADFNYILAGTYRVCELKPTGWQNTQPGGAAPCYTTTVNPGQTATLNFGNRYTGLSAADANEELAPLSPQNGVTIVEEDHNGIDGYTLDPNGPPAVVELPVDAPVETPGETQPVFDATSFIYLPVVTR
jgi:hypothetical protein